MKRKLVVLGLVVSALAVGVFVVKKTGLLYTRRDAERELLAAKNAAEEFATFDRIAQHTRVHFALYDAAGEQLGMSTSDWPKLAQVIRFYQFGEPPIDYTIIDRNNISTLMRE